MLKQKLSFETDTQDLLLEEWYWHTLYFMRRSDAKSAQKWIVAVFDECCELVPHFGQYSVAFSTNYLFEAEHQQQLARLLEFEPVETSFNETGEDLLDIFPWPELELGETNPKARTRITHDRCVLCGIRPRASYGLWCIACKRASLKSRGQSSEQSLEEELDFCPFCGVSLDQGHWCVAVRIVACLVLAALFLLAVLVVAVLPGLLTGMFVGLVLWWLRGRREKHAACSTLF